MYSTIGTQTCETVPEASIQKSIRTLYMQLLGILKLERMLYLKVHPAGKDLEGARSNGLS